MKQFKRTLGALVLTGVTFFGSLGLSAAPAKADGSAGAAIIGAIVGYGLYKAGKNDDNDHRGRGHYGYDRNRYGYDNRYDNRYGYKRDDRYSYRDGYRDGHRDGHRHESHRNDHDRYDRDRYDSDRYRSNYGGYNRSNSNYRGGYSRR